MDVRLLSAERARHWTDCMRINVHALRWNVQVSAWSESTALLPPPPSRLDYGLQSFFVTIILVFLS